MAAKLQDTAVKNVERTVGKHRVICQSIQFLDEQKSTSKTGLGDSKDEKMFRSHLSFNTNRAPEGS